VFDALKLEFLRLQLAGEDLDGPGGIHTVIMTPSWRFDKHRAVVISRSAVQSGSPAQVSSNNGCWGPLLYAHALRFKRNAKSSFGVSESCRPERALPASRKGGVFWSCGAYKPLGSPLTSERTVGLALGHNITEWAVCGPGEIGVGTGSPSSPADCLSRQRLRALPDSAREPDARRTTVDRQDAGPRTRRA
jgi:hypothetical protein